MIEDVFNNTAQSCIARAEGNQKEADYLSDCSYFDYYYRILNYNEWAKRRAEAIKNATRE